MTVRSLGVSILIMAGCCLAAPLAVAEESANDRLLAAYLEVWSSGEVERLDEVVAVDFKRHAGPDESPSSRDELVELIDRTQNLYRRLRFEVAEVFTTADGGAMRGELTGGYKSTDRAVRIPVMALYRFEDGKLAEEWMLADNVPTLLALSFTIAPPGYDIVPPPDAASAANGSEAAEEE